MRKKEGGTGGSISGCGCGSGSAPRLRLRHRGCGCGSGSGSGSGCGCGSGSGSAAPAPCGWWGGGRSGWAALRAARLAIDCRARAWLSSRSHRVTALLALQGVWSQKGSRSPTCHPHRVEREAEGGEPEGSAVVLPLARGHPNPTPGHPAGTMLSVCARVVQLGILRAYSLGCVVLHAWRQCSQRLGRRCCGPPSLSPAEQVARLRQRWGALALFVPFQHSQGAGAGRVGAFDKVPTHVAVVLDCSSVCRTTPCPCRPHPCT